MAEDLFYPPLTAADVVFTTHCCPISISAMIMTEAMKLRIWAALRFEADVKTRP